ncbi:MAG: hypothetical protein HQL84_11430 [Magnetococcales bacterium]|nr:hypothetical protein [Magnetococcales bacterium]MBF0150646.1 hypothetical protein [Magnetococcales bacterium]
MEETLKKPRFLSLKEWLRNRIRLSGTEGRSGLRMVSPWILNLLLLPLFAFDLFGEISSMLRAIESQTPVTTAGQQTTNPSGSVAQKDKIDLTQMTQWHPFGGKKVPGANLEGADTKNLPDTNLNFQLHGILFIEGTSIPAFALIKLADAPEKVFAIGEVLTGDVRLVAIQNDRVILDRGGRLEALKLPRAVLQIRDPDA